MADLGGRRYRATVSLFSMQGSDGANGCSVDVCEVEEDCAHTVQYLGMCTNCGKDMTM
jgi:hypothetical protein